MNIRPIRTDADHKAALREIDRLWNAPEDSSEWDKVDVLTTLVEVYERNRWPLDRQSPRDILGFAISDMGRTQSELAELLGSRSQASDFLTGRRRISLKAAQTISQAWHIPIQLLVAPYPDKAKTASNMSRKRKVAA